MSGTKAHKRARSRARFLAAAFELLFEQNGGPPQWRDRIFGYRHFYARAHERVGVTGG